MYLEQLVLDSFRGFQHCTLDFPGAPGATLLVGSNGAGKTSVLDAIATLASDLVASMAPEEYRQHKIPLLEKDVPIGGMSAHLKATAKIGARPLRLGRLRQRRGGYLTEDVTTTSDLQPFAQQWWKEADAGGSVDLPLVVYYGSERTWLGSPEGAPDTKQLVQFEAHSHSLDASAAPFQQFFEWFRQREDLENENNARGIATVDPQLQATRAAVEEMLGSGYSELRIWRSPLRMTLKKSKADGGSDELTMDQLSHGEKALVAMVGDLARRLSLASPKTPNAREAPALVLIDEIELHLHPGWQRVVVERLTKTFPKCQFIMTTHSPQVLSAVPAESVIALENFKQYRLPAETDGRDTNSILSEIMGVSERPEWATAELHEIALRMDADQHDEARAAIQSLAQRLGEHDSEIVRLRALLGLLEGKA